MAQQIKAELQAVAWLDGSAEVVFGARSVFVFAGAPPNEDAIPPGFPFALVTIDSGAMDEDAPELIDQSFSIITAAEVAGDPLGEFAVIGSSRADLGKSAGAGVAEVAERVRAAVQDLTGADGAKVLLSASATGAPVSLGRGKHLAFDELTLTAVCTSQPHYAAPQQLAKASDVWTWVGPHCSDRFDFLQYRLGYVAGSTPASDPGSATIVYTGSAATTTHTPVAGRAYSIWADYDPRGTGSVAHSSDGSLVGAYLTT
jgi:hypothetical protein